MQWWLSKVDLILCQYPCGLAGHSLSDSVAQSTYASIQALADLLSRLADRETAATLEQNSQQAQRKRKSIVDGLTRTPAGDTQNLVNTTFESALHATDAFCRKIQLRKIIGNITESRPILFSDMMRQKTSDWLTTNDNVAKHKFMGSETS